MFTLWRCWSSGCSHMLTHMHRPFKCYKHKWNINTQISTSTMYSMWCFVVRSARGARILNPLMLLATPRMRTSAGADFPLMLSTSSSTNNRYLISLTKPCSRIPCTLNFLIIHTHRSNLHYHPRTWAEHQLPFGGSCARARSSQPFVWKSFLLMAIWDHRRYRKYAWICGVCASNELLYLFCGCW